MSCEEVKTAKYQTRKSPSFHAGECKDMTKKGKDGDYISKPDVRGVYKWVKVAAGTGTGTGAGAGAGAGTGKGTGTRKKSKSVKTYTILDNGNRPFQVNVNGKTVEIYKGENYTTLVKKLTVQDVYPGELLCDPAIMIGRETGCDKEDRGNTVLLHVSGNKYIYVGSTIYEFTMEDDVEAYYSLVGPNQTPCPVLLGSKNIYLLGSGIREYVPREIFKGPMSPAEWADGEAYYYGLKVVATGKKKDNSQPFRKIGKKFITKIKGIKEIHKRI